MVRQVPPGRARDSHTRAAWTLVAWAVAWLVAEDDAPFGLLHSQRRGKPGVDHLALALAPARRAADSLAALQQKTGLARSLVVRSPACRRRHRRQPRAPAVARSWCRIVAAADCPWASLLALSVPGTLLPLL